jgi:hypothetical protein
LNPRRSHAEADGSFSNGENRREVIDRLFTTLVGGATIVSINFDRAGFARGCLWRTTWKTSMKQSLFAGLLAAALLSSSSPVSASLPRGILWQSDLGAAHRLSQQTHKPMLVVCGAGWCTWCRKLEQTTLSNPQLGSYINANFVPVHIDADRDQRVIQALHAESLPTAVVLGPNFENLGRISGYKDVAGYHALLAGAASRLPASAPQNTVPAPTLPAPSLAPRTPPSNVIVQVKATTPAAVKPAPYYKVYPTYPQFHRGLPMNGAG